MENPEMQALMALQAERFEAAQSYIEGRIENVKVDGTRVGSLLRSARSASKPADKVKWLHRGASAWAECVAPHAACREGCNHCCHIPVAITEIEARLMGEVTGRKVVLPRDAQTFGAPTRSLVNQAYIGKPCPFLKGGRCSAYQARPMVCRLHFNMDVDDFLCRLVPGNKTNVPYADSTEIQKIYMEVLRHQRIADIREFFPGKGGTP